MKSAREIALEKFKEKPVGYEANYESVIYADAFEEGIVFILKKLTEIYTPSSLDTMYEAMENESMQNFISKMREELQC